MAYSYLFQTQLFLTISLNKVMVDHINRDILHTNNPLIT